MLFDVKLKKTWFPGLKAQAHVSVFQPGVSRQAHRTATTLSVAYAWDIVTVRGPGEQFFLGLDLILEIPLFLYLEVGGRGRGGDIRGT